MKSRFHSIVNLKKDKMQKSEQALSQANKNLANAQSALEESYESLKDLNPPQTGSMGDFLASRSLASTQRGIIEHNQKWVEYAKKEILAAKEQLKKDMIEHEKFKYLELEEIKKEMKKRQIKEAKDLDEVALMTYARGKL
jgi:flagellar biosynthesis chaperone FliJ